MFVTTWTESEHHSLIVELFFSFVCVGFFLTVNCVWVLSCVRNYFLLSGSDFSSTYICLKTFYIVIIIIMITRFYNHII